MFPYDAGDIIGECGAAVARCHMSQERGEVLVEGINDLHLEGLNKEEIIPKEAVD